MISGNFTLPNFKCMFLKTTRTKQCIALGKAIKQLRITHNFKHEYIADQIGLSVSSLYKMEQGLTCVRFTDMHKIGRGLKISLDEIGLLYEKELEKMSPPPPPRGK
jgi:transcriptional regulator with XRE-family HTH domain